MNKFYNFNFGEEKNELYVYGAIISGNEKWDETDVTFSDFRDKLESMNNNSTLDIFINSPGGDVFVTQSIVSMISRAKERGIKINCTIDGLGASCASWLPMIADNVYIYDGSIMMVHKPMTGFMLGANADAMKKEIEILDKIENDVIIPLYMKKTKEGISREYIAELLAKETWLNSSEIQDIFNITLLEDTKKIACCIDKDIFKNYKNTPDELLSQDKEVNKMENEDIKNNEVIEETKPLEENKIVEDIGEASNEEEIIDEVVKDEKSNEETEVVEDENIEHKNIELKLNEANQKIIDLNDKIEELQKIADLYNAEQLEKSNAEKERLLNEKKDYYKNKFEKLGAKDKYESEEIQTLVNNCIKDKDSLLKLNQIVVDMISLDNKVVQKDIIEPVSKVENLIPEADGAEKYGFR